MCIEETKCFRPHGIYERLLCKSVHKTVEDFDELSARTRFIAGMATVWSKLLWRSFRLRWNSLFPTEAVTMSGDCQTPAILPVSCSLTSISLSDDLPMCRVCHNTGGKKNEPLHRVCWCKGTMGEVHKSCLETWLSAVFSDRCPICHYHFRTRRIFKPLRQVMWRDTCSWAHFCDLKRF